MKAIKLLIIAGLVIMTGVSAGFSLPKISEVLASLDDRQNLGGDISSLVTNLYTKKNQGTKEYVSLFFRRDKSDSFLMIMLAPDSEKGNGYLKTGNDMWMYRQNTRSFQHINRDESINGTDARAGDFERRKLNELYQGAVDKDGNELISEELLGKAKIPVYKLEVTAKVNDVTYPKQVYWVRKDNFLPLRVQSYSANGTLMATVNFLKYQLINGKYFNTRMLFVDEFEKGTQTSIEISGISLNRLDDAIFTKGYLENLSK